MAKMRRQQVLGSLGVLLIGLFILAGCTTEREEQTSVGTSRLSLRLTTDNQASSSDLRGAETPSGILRVSPDDRLFAARLDVDIRVSDTGVLITNESFELKEPENESGRVTIELEKRVPTRQNLTITVDVFNDQPEPEKIFSGSLPVFLTQSTETRTIDLIRQFLPAAITPSEFSSLVSNRAFRFDDGTIFGGNGEARLRLGALVNNTGRFALTVGNVTTTGEVVIRTPSSTSSQRRATTGELRQDGDNVLCDFIPDSGVSSGQGLLGGETLFGSCQEDAFDTSLGITDLGTGQTAFSDPSELAVNTSPNVAIIPTEDVSITTGGQVDFSATCTDSDGLLSTTWNFDGVAPDAPVLDPAPVTFATPGIFTIIFECTDVLGAVSSALRTVTVESLTTLTDIVVTVIDVTTNDVLDGATVTVEGQSNTSDANGLMTFANVPVGTISVTVARENYLTHVFVRPIHTDTTGLNLFLYPLGDETLDTDNDGFPDGVESNTGLFLSALNTGTDPSNADTDGDRLNDGVEILVEEVRLGN